MALAALYWGQRPRFSADAKVTELVLQGPRKANPNQGLSLNEDLFESVTALELNNRRLWPADEPETSDAARGKETRPALFAHITLTPPSPPGCGALTVSLPRTSHERRRLLLTPTLKNGCKTSRGWVLTYAPAGGKTAEPEPISGGASVELAFTLKEPPLYVLQNLEVDEFYSGSLLADPEVPRGDKVFATSIRAPEARISRILIEGASGERPTLSARLSVSDRAHLEFDGQTEGWQASSDVLLLASIALFSLMQAAFAMPSRADDEADEDAGKEAQAV